MAQSMTRYAPQKPGGPTTANVHDDMVQNYREGGWRVVGEDPALSAATVGQLQDRIAFLAA